MVQLPMDSVPPTDALPETVTAVLDGGGAASLIYRYPAGTISRLKVGASGLTDGLAGKRTE